MKKQRTKFDLESDSFLKGVYNKTLNMELIWSDLTEVKEENPLEYVAVYPTLKKLYCTSVYINPTTSVLVYFIIHKKNKQEICLKEGGKTIFLKNILIEDSDFEQVIKEMN